MLFRSRDERLVINYHAVGMITLYLALAMSWISALDYFLRFVRAVQAQSPPTVAAPGDAAPPTPPTAPTAPEGGGHDPGSSAGA